MKYYWLAYTVNGLFRETTLVNSHPFAFINAIRKENKLVNPSLTHVLLNWKEITYDEFSIFNKID